MRRSSSAFYLLPLMLVAFVVGCGSCETIEGSGNIEEREFEASGFTRVDTCCGWRVIITQGENEGVRVRGDDNIIDEIVLRQTGQTVDIDYRDRSMTFLPTQRVRVEVTVSELESYTGSGGSDVLLNPLDVGDLQILLSGGSQLEARNLQADLLDLNCSGGGAVEIQGGVLPTQDILLSGGSTYDASPVETQTADFNLSGGSRATAWVTDTLDVTASGGSQMRYFGDPDVEQSLSGGSTVERLGSEP